MDIYLPIAEMSLNIFLLIGMGAGVGFLSGMFGIGGGFLITPFLIFFNVPPAIAVGTSANQVIGSSTTGAVAHFKRRTLDIKLGILLVLGGLLGSILGVHAFSLLRAIGQLDLIIALLYVVLLGGIGIMMAIESFRALLRRHHGKNPVIKRPGNHNWILKMPFKVRFRTSMLYVSIIPVLMIGFTVGALSSIMGIGGGFVLVPAMIYILRVPTNVVVGTSLFQVTFVSAFTTIMQAVTNQSVDVVLAFLLMVGGVIGAQYGTRAGRHLKAEQLRLLMAVLVLAIALRLAFQLFIKPDDIFNLTLINVSP